MAACSFTLKKKFQLFWSEKMEFERISVHMIASYGVEEGHVQSWLKQASHEIFFFLMDSAIYVPFHHLDSWEKKSWHKFKCLKDGHKQNQIEGNALRIGTQNLSLLLWFLLHTHHFCPSLLWIRVPLGVGDRVFSVHIPNIRAVLGQI